MSNTVHKSTVLDMLERDVENKYSLLKSNLTNAISSLSERIPLVGVALPAINKWLSGKESEMLPKVQGMINTCVEMSFLDIESTIEDAYDGSKKLFNDMLDEFIKSHSTFTLASFDQISEILLGLRVSL